MSKDFEMTYDETKEKIMADKWQPIKTAPKDGTEILTYSEKWGVKQLCWKEIYYQAGSWGASLPVDQQGAWVQFNGDPNKMGCFNPTNELIKWQPVPEGPKP